MPISAWTLRNPSSDNCGSREVISAIVESSNGLERFILRHSSTQASMPRRSCVRHPEGSSFDPVPAGGAEGGLHGVDRRPVLARSICVAGLFV